MNKLLILTVFAFAGLVQLSRAANLGEALNNNIRVQLRLYDIFAKDADAAKYADDLKKLVQITEGALKTESVEEKETTINNIHTNFSEEFNQWIATKLEHAEVNDDIYGAITFYSSLLQQHTPHEAEIKKTIATLENLLKETDLKKKETEFVGLTKTFSPEFEAYLKQSSLPVIQDTLQKTLTFFQTVLDQQEGKFEKEIMALKAKVVAAMADSVSVEEKNRVLSDVSDTSNKELNEYLARKNIELA
ncbi:uncharacterized protein [Musca autumnalis]|uniref:uncharacterized protein n=1 Tax=Musca autumnalis TaxID=221902 RepID=UPI003CEB1CA3